MKDKLPSKMSGMRSRLMPVALWGLFSGGQAHGCNLESAEFFLTSHEQTISRCVHSRYTERNVYMGLEGAPLHYAASFTRDPAVITEMLGAGMDVNTPLEDGETPLHRAALNNTEVAVIQTLLAAGADIDRLDSDGATPLHHAAYNNIEPEILATLLAAGAAINARTPYGITPLHWAALNNAEPAIVMFLLQAGADPTLTIESGETPGELLVDNPHLKNNRQIHRALVVDR